MVLTNFNASLPCTLNSYHFYLISKFLIKKPISNNSPLKHSASDFTQLQSGIVRDFECCWVTVQSAFLSIKCLRASDRTHKRQNRDEWNCFNSITLREQNQYKYPFRWDNEVERVTLPLSNLCCNFNSFILSVCATESEMCYFSLGELSHKSIWLEKKGILASTDLK